MGLIACGLCVQFIIGDIVFRKIAVTSGQRYYHISRRDGGNKTGPPVARLAKRYAKYLAPNDFAFEKRYLPDIYSTFIIKYSNLKSLTIYSQKPY